ncbi:hypothetical protein VM95_11530 [Streptomyces rubellomurinus]|uniref:Uncharacterized protein n=1 Tax=Streptomyces rubellomurinus (strain ATCC 31215) TaxID=359131 RepID=A0A0F2TI86_STRR3|nr:hypothetical protein VM95_11530 [Streptomyces rubellomurinus]
MLCQSLAPLAGPFVRRASMLVGIRPSFRLTCAAMQIFGHWCYMAYLFVSAHFRVRQLPVSAGLYREERVLYSRLSPELSL